MTTKRQELVGLVEIAEQSATKTLSLPYVTHHKKYEYFKKCVCDFSQQCREYLSSGDINNNEQYHSHVQNMIWINDFSKLIEMDTLEYGKAQQEKEKQSINPTINS